MKFLKYLVFISLAIVLLSCKQGKKYHDIAEKQEILPQTDALAEIIQFQKELNEEFRDPETSPLPDRFRKNFEGLDFFEPDTNYIVKAKFTRTPEAIPFMMPRTTGDKSEEVMYGIVSFVLNGKNHQLEIYQNEELMKKEGFEDYLFLPFTDNTNTKETYGGGRYIDMRIPSSNEITIDFNRAYNPYCAYNKKYSCPIVPGINALDTRIVAGVKDFKKGKK
ncbi:DUF1684 domain-containing protein [Aurantibacter sp.]|uniref:DUF1684 domain-containing protein n=1 Tax=Aurantibacter sp. TaxID=2807103 RepID=UPI00326453EB